MRDLTQSRRMYSHFKILFCTLSIMALVMGAFPTSLLAAPDDDDDRMVSSTQVASEPNRIYQQGVAFDISGNELEARKSYERAAAMGHMMAQYCLA